MGKRSSVTFVSWRQTTSGPSWVSQGPSVSRRTRSEFTFQVAIRSMSSPQLVDAHPGHEVRWASLASRRAFVLAFVLTQQAEAQFKGHLIFGDFPITD